jgi:microcin C transport system substrate-binding protein
MKTTPKCSRTRPATKPRYARGIPETWWYDRDKAATIDQ